MKIQTLSKPDEEYRQQYKKELVTLLEQPTDKELRPCPECHVLCPTHKSPTCTCNCTPDCFFTASKMSSDGERYPVEEKIRPLVYSLYTLRICTPCWSCEGHYKPNGFELSKVPKVWFYSRSLIYPRLVSEHLSLLKSHKKIHYAWHISVTYSESEIDTCFSIEPLLDLKKNIKLDYLQSDSQKIGESLRESVHELARQYLRKLEAHP